MNRYSVIGEIYASKETWNKYKNRAEPYFYIPGDRQLNVVIHAYSQPNQQQCNEKLIQEWMAKGNSRPYGAHCTEVNKF